MSDNFNNGWQTGFDWVKTNYIIDAAGNINIGGGFLDNFRHLDSRLLNGIAEGVLYGLSSLDTDYKKYVWPNKNFKWFK